MYTTFTYQVCIGNDYNETTKKWDKKLWADGKLTYHSKNDREAIEGADEFFKEQEKIGNVRYVSKCKHDNQE